MFARATDQGSRCSAGSMVRAKGPAVTFRSRVDRPVSGVGEADVAELVRRSSDGEQEAWDELVRRFSGLVWGIARQCGLSKADAEDVSQVTWLRLVEQLGRLRQPERVAGWLAITARRESYRVSGRKSKELPVGDVVDVATGSASGADAALIASERDMALWSLLGALPDNCQRLMQLLVGDPPPSYAEISTTLGIPIGSIGPTRQRCLDRLRRLAEQAGITPQDA